MSESKPAGDSGLVFQGKRYVQEMEAKVRGTIDEIFPLLCPVREYDWIPHWRCDLIYSGSGVNENNCVFVTHFPDENPTVWVTTLHDPQAGRVEFVRYIPDRRIVKMDIQVSEADEGFSKIHWRYSQTGLSDAGNSEVVRDIEQEGRKYRGHFTELMDLLRQFLDRNATTSIRHPSA